MSSPGGGGEPTTTKHSQSFTTSYVNAAVYTCPADTICYFNLSNINIQSVSGSVANIHFYINTGVVTDIYNVSIAQIVQVISFDVFNAINLKDFYNRLNNPTVTPGSTPTTPIIGGQIILFPTDTLGVSLTAGTGTYSGVFTYSTLEVTSA